MIEDTINESECVYYCVGTPYQNDGQADLTFFYNAIEHTLASLKDERRESRASSESVNISPPVKRTSFISFLSDKKEHASFISSFDAGPIILPAKRRLKQCLQYAKQLSVTRKAALFLYRRTRRGVTEYSFSI